ncbi:MAG: PP2C family protein-serine/threonine phosphatase [Acidobacteriota bacterium]
MNYKVLFRKLHKTIREIERSEDISKTLFDILKRLINEFHEEMGLVGGRLYKSSNDSYVLIHQYSLEGKKVRPGYKISITYKPLQDLLEHGFVIMDENDPGFDRRVERVVGVSFFAAIAIGEENRHIIAFTLRPGIKREDVIYSLNTIRHVINLKLRQEELEDIIQEAKKIQQSILPRSFPKFADYDIYGMSIPAEDVGGDLYDFLPISDRVLGVAVADSSGHGFPAALQARDAITGLRMGIEEHFKIIKTIEKLNRIISKSSLATKFISLFYGEFEANGNLIYCNAGHPPPILFRKDMMLHLKKGGLVLGPNPLAKYERGFVNFQHGTILVIYTDGITEASNHEGNLFGIKRLERVILKHIGESSESITKRIFEKVERFSRGCSYVDDRTVVIVKR